MSNIDKQASQVSRYDLVSGYMQKWPDGEFVYHSDYQALLDELEAKDKSISFLKDQLAQLANFNPDWDKLEAATDSLREHMAKLSSAEKRIADQLGIIASARKFISEYAGLGDVGAAEFVKIIDRAAAAGKGE
ncbi:hypothetical protein [Enterobacter kobei]|uniref:hypothetical protein n=2 Tax=Enterobacter kobei TaxID=208224 RepID=UPI002A7667A9|nr:hypothetical protein [Enterobacter kobei]MDY3578611.1 hypothetical protein [Enterobacter kobei]